MVNNRQVKAALFSIVLYQPRPAQGDWPAPGADYSSETARASMERALEQFELADQLGFDWVTVAEHHYSRAAVHPTQCSTRPRESAASSVWASSS